MRRPTLIISFVSAICLSGFSSFSHGALPDQLNIAVGDVDGNGLDDTLVLTKRSLRSTDYRVHTWNATDGYLEITPPQVRTYRGHVSNDSSLQVNAYITPDGRLQANITNGTAFDEGGYSVRDLPVLPPDDPLGTVDGTADNLVIPRTIDRSVPTLRGFIIPQVVMSRMRVGLELRADWVAALGGIDAAVSLAEQRINDADHFYARDMGLAWEISEVVVRTDTDPGNWKSFWNGSDAVSPLPFNTKIRFKPGGGGGSSGRVFQSGIAFPNSHSCTVGSTSPYARSVGHEVGHGMGGGHGTANPCVMSGSDSAIGYGTVQRMIEQLHLSPEAGTPEVIYNGLLHPRAMEDAFNTPIDTAVDMDLRENDYDGNGDSFDVTAVTSGENGATVAILPDGRVRYSPAPGFVGPDSFSYSITDSSGLTNPNGKVKIYVRNAGLATHLVLDELSGISASDFGEFNRTASLEGTTFDTATTPGVIGNALHLAPGQTLRCPGVGDPLDGNFSVSLWYRPETDITTTTTFIYKGGISSKPDRLGKDTFRGGWAIGCINGRLHFTCEGQADLEHTHHRASLEADSTLVAGQWYHLAMVIDRDSQQLRAWVDNQELTTSPDGTTLPNQLIDSFLDFRLNGDEACTIDDVRLYNIALTPADVAELHLADPDIPAGKPFPADRSVDQVAGISLSWSPGIPLVYPEFDIYFGTDPALVAAADSASSEYQGRQSVTGFLPLTTVGVTYYWRIDEVKADNTILAGKIWQFSTSDRFIFPGTPANRSFEDPIVKPSSSVSHVNHWYEEGSYTYTVWEGSSSFPETNSGDNWCELGNSKWIYQQIGYYVEGQTIGISGKIGRKANTTYRGLKIRILAGGDPSAAGKGITPEALGAVEIASTESTIKPTLAVLESADFEISFGTGTGFTLGSPLWIEIAQDGGSGRALVDDLRIFDTNQNRGPIAVKTPFQLPLALPTESYLADLRTQVTDPDGDDSMMTFELLAGPHWLTIDDDGQLGGIPEAGDVGSSICRFAAEDPDGGRTEFTTILEVGEPDDGNGPDLFAISSFGIDPSTGNVQLAWVDSGTSCWIECSDDLSWASPTVIDVTAGNGTVTSPESGIIAFEFIDPGAFSPRRFYRVAKTVTP